MSTKQCFTIEEFAHYIDCSVNEAIIYIEEEMIPYCKKDNKFEFFKSDIDKLIWKKNFCEEIVKKYDNIILITY